MLSQCKMKTVRMWNRIGGWTDAPWSQSRAEEGQVDSALKIFNFIQQFCKFTKSIKEHLQYACKMLCTRMSPWLRHGAFSAEIRKIRVDRFKNTFTSLVDPTEAVPAASRVSIQYYDTVTRQTCMQFNILAFSVPPGNGAVLYHTYVLYTTCTVSCAVLCYFRCTVQYCIVFGIPGLSPGLTNLSHLSLFLSLVLSLSSAWAFCRLKGSLHKRKEKKQKQK